MLDALDSFSSSVAGDRGHKAAQAKALSKADEEAEYDRVKTGQAVDRIQTILADGPMSPGNLSAKMAPSLRPFRDAAIGLLEVMGKVHRDGKRWRL